jgi:hypothetical protein
MKGIMQLKWICDQYMQRKRCVYHINCFPGLRAILHRGDMNAEHLTIVKRVKEKNVFVDNLRYGKSEVKTEVGITLILQFFVCPLN